MRALNSRASLSLHKGWRGGSRWAQRGFGLLEVVLLSLLISGVVVGGFVAMRNQQQTQAAEMSGDVLRRSDRAIVSFVAQNHRLPCPDADGDGKEDANPAGDGCLAAAGQKGWLPLRTLGLEGAGTVQGAMPRLVYLVQRQAQDLGRADATRYNPPAFDNDATPPAYSGVRAINHLSTADVCQGIEQARSTPLAADQAQSGGHAVAYALVHPGAGDADGSGSGFDGLNRLGAASNEVEAAERGWTLGTYNDRVRVQTYAGLSAALNCSQLLASERNLGFAAEWVDEVDEQKTSTRNSAILSSTINGIKSGVALIKTGLAVKGLANAITHLTAATTALTAALASLVGIVLAPSLIAAVGAAIAAIAAYSVTIVLAASSLAASLVALGLSISVAVQAGAEVNASFNLDSVRAQAQTAYTDAVTREADAQTRYDDALARRDSTATPDYNTAVSNLESKVSGFASHVTSMNDCGSHSTDYNCSPALTLSTYQSQINAVKSAVSDLVAKEMAYQDAEAAYQRAIDGANNPKPSAPANSPLPADVRKSLVDALDVAKKAGDTAKVTGLTKAIEYLDSQQASASTYTDSQRVTDLAAQIGQVQKQIDGYTTQINALDAQIGSTPCNPLPTTEPTRQQCVDRDMLAQQRSQSQALKAGLQDQMANLTLDVATALSLRDAALTQRNAAQSALDAATNSLNNSLESMRYTTCTRGVNKGTNGNPDTPWSSCTIKYYQSISNDSTQWVSQTVLGHTYEGFYKDYTIKLNEVTRTGYAWAVADKDVQQSQATLTRAKQDVTDAQSTVQALSGVNATGISVWTGAADVVDRADAKGGIR
jgi:hypothetical protein